MSGPTLNLNGNSTTGPPNNNNNNKFLKLAGVGPTATDLIDPSQPGTQPFRRMPSRRHQRRIGDGASHRKFFFFLPLSFLADAPSGLLNFFPPRPPHHSVIIFSIGSPLTLKGAVPLWKQCKDGIFLFWADELSFWRMMDFSFCGFIYVYKFYARSFVSEAIYNILVDSFLSLSFFLFISCLCVIFGIEREFHSCVMFAHARPSCWANICWDILF